MPAKNSGLPLSTRTALFLKLCADIRAHEPYKAGGFGLTVHVAGGREALDAMQGPAVHVTPESQVALQRPDRTEWRSYLLAFRQFLMPGDTTSLSWFIEHLPEHLKDPDSQGDIARARREWDQANGPGWMPFTDSGQQILGSEVAELYLYGNGIFHTNAEKAARWHALSDAQQAAYEFRFYLFIAQVREAVIIVRDVLQKAQADSTLREE